MRFEAGTLSGSWRANGVGNDLMQKSNVGPWNRGTRLWFFFSGGKIEKLACRCLI